MKCIQSPIFKVLMLAGMCVLGGCAGATMTPTMRADRSLPRPDLFIVNDFAVTPDEVKLDRGLLATAIRDAGNRTPTEEENRVGHMVAEKLSVALVNELRNAGIRAVRGGSGVHPSDTTAILHGQFVTIDQGNQTGRVWVGFGLGGSELQTQIQLVQGGTLVASAQTSTTKGLKPGMLVSLGAGAAGAGAAIAVGAAGTGVSEAFTATVEADASRTAKEVVKHIRKAYVDRGWLPG